MSAVRRFGYHPALGCRVMVHLMFDMHVDDTGETARIVVRPNQSMSWHGNLMLLASLGIVTFSIAIGFALQGLWLVLPFAGLEVLLVGIGLYATCRRLSRSEVISVSPYTVSIESGIRRPEHSYRLHRCWARVDLCLGRTRSEPTRLLVGSHGKAVEVGVSLTDSERSRLAVELRRLIPGGKPGP